MANYNWINSSGSADWSSASNWGGGVAGEYPGESGTTDVATLSTPNFSGNSYAVTYDPTTAAIPYPAVTLGGLTLQGTGTRLTTLTLSGGSTMTVDGAILVGSNNVNATGAAIMGSGTLDAGGGALVTLTTNGTGGLTTTTGASSADGIGANVVLGVDSTAGSVLQVGSSTGSTLSNTFAFSGTAGGTLSLTAMTASSLNFTGTIDGMNVASSNSNVAGVNFIEVGNATITNVTWTTGGNTITLMNGASVIQTLTLGTTITSGEFVDWISNASATGKTGGQNSITGTDIFISTVVCFAAGTRILTADGETSIEALSEGDLVVTVNGVERTLAPVTWVGHRRVDLAAHPRRELVAPVCIRRGAFSENMPHRDLVVSPDHALFVDDKLVVARLLLNGMTITQDLDARSVEYYHVELPKHVVLLAEGLTAESYLDTGNRSMFSNAGLALVLHPDFGVSHGVSTWAADSCAPLATEAAEVEPIWRRLAERAGSLGYSVPSYATTTEPDLQVMANGRRLRPLAIEGERYVFVLPAGAETIRLTSRADAPADIAPYQEDRRRLGVAVGRLTFRAGTEMRDVPVDHPMLTLGWHAAEREGLELRRWTDGDAHLPVPFEAGVGLVTLEVQTTCQATYRVDQPAMDRRMVA
jgi:hypothetical protein